MADQIEALGEPLRCAHCREEIRPDGVDWMDTTTHTTCENTGWLHTPIPAPPSPTPPLPGPSEEPSDPRTRAFNLVEDWREGLVGAEKQDGEPPYHVFRKDLTQLREAIAALVARARSEATERAAKEADAVQARAAELMDVGPQDRRALFIMREGAAREIAERIRAGGGE